ncbi:MAG: type VI secretion system ATPase TssH, partial [Clostridia bacterium]|nr:type VI secretion system ATPase TssH [Clostridia bacterium]
MNFEKFTIKSQEAIRKAIETVKENGQQRIDTPHLFKAVAMTGENVIAFVFNKMGINQANLMRAVEEKIAASPRVSGGEPYLGEETIKVLDRSERYAREGGDQYVSLEYILLALLTEKNEVGDLMRDAGMREQDMRAAINELRKGNTVKSQNAEETYRSLEKYAVNLNEKALNGKLDPVIGRDDEIRRVLQILSRRTKNNPILIGEPGTGKTAIAEG